MGGVGMPPVFVLMLGTLGALAFARWVGAEARRINAELHPIRNEPASDPPIPTLRRDPVSGVYRPD
jgi:hypothetical protein